MTPGGAQEITDNRAASPAFRHGECQIGWCKANIENNSFAENGSDYTGFVTTTNGNKTKI